MTRAVPRRAVADADYSDDTCAEIAKHDPGTGPEQSSGHGAEQEGVRAEGDHTGETGGEWVHAGQDLATMR